jgi:hypothetical protein
MTSLLQRTVSVKLRYLVLRPFLRPLQDHALAQLIGVDQAVGESDAVGAHGIAAPVVEIPVAYVDH